MHNIGLITAFLFVATLNGGVEPALAHDYTKGMIRIGHPWVRPSPSPSVKVGVAYMSITNLGSSDDVLVGVKSGIAATVEFHETTVENGVARMRQKKAGVIIPAGETLALKPGGVHIMFKGLKASFKEDELFAMTLVFRKAGEVTVEAISQVPEGAGTIDQNAHKHEQVKKQ